MSDSDQRCCYCNAIISVDDDAQRVSKHEVAHTACAFAVSDTFFAALDNRSEYDDAEHNAE